MAGLVNSAAAVVKAWWHYARLDQVDIESGRKSMEAMKELGNPSLAVLRHGIRQHESPRIQLRCAVVLHWMGHREGLPVLIDALRYNTRSRKDSTGDIIDGFILVGAPDATQALIGVWQQLPGIHDNDPTAILICRIWRMLRDSRMLTVLCETSVQTQRLFIETVADFGTDAFPELQKLAADGDPAGRTMALRGLEQIPGYESARIVIPMLRDANAEVRAVAASALEAISGPVTTLNGLVDAHRAGYSTAVSVEMLVMYNPPDLYALLAGLLTRYEPAPISGSAAGWDDEGADTVGAARESANAFVHCPWPHAQVTQLLCGVASRGVHPTIKAAAARSIAERGRAGDDSDILAYKTMWRQLTIADRDARGSAATALARLGEPFGKSFEALLDAGRPHGNLIHKLHSTLVNSQDVGQAMTEAVQHVATWFNRVSRVTVNRFSTQPSDSFQPDGALRDHRLPDLLRLLLGSVLDNLEGAGSPDETVEMISVGVGAMRAISRLDPASSLSADAEVRRAFTVVAWKGASSGANRGSAVGDDAAGILREAAGLAMIDIHGSTCFEALCAGLTHRDDFVRVTSASTLGRLGDPIATPLLQSAADTGSPFVARAAREAIAAIKRGNPEMMTLLRGSSSADARPETLLRPAAGMGDAISSDLLLRPGQPEQN